MNNYVKFITNVDRRRQIHVGNLTFHDDNQVAINLSNDIFQSIDEVVRELGIKTEIGIMDALIKGKPKNKTELQC